jgi:vesicular inhibitory amino acid transporter
MAKESLESVPRNGTADVGTTSNSTENSPLMPPSESGESTNSESQLWEEMNRPWPSTFERSISLLASPIQPRIDVEKFTKSPKAGASPMALARRSDFEMERTHDNFQLGVSKVHSLDYSTTPEYLDSVTEEQQRKAMKAKEYRAQILKNQGKGKGKAGAKKIDDMPPKDGKATFSQCIFNFVNILMGVGLLGLPYVFKKGGWLGGSLCLFLFSAAAWRTSILIGRELNGDPRPCHYFHDSPYKSLLLPGSAANARMLPPTTSFPDIARTSFGDGGTILIAVILYFELFICICVLLVAMGDHLHKLFPTIPFNAHTTVVAFISLVPTVLLKTPALLSYLSMVGTISTGVLVAAVILSYVFEGDMTEEIAEREGIVDGGPYHEVWDPSGIAIALGMVSYCFSGHAIVPAIYTTMEKPQEFEQMVTVSFIIVVFSCFSMAFSGYIMFGSLVDEEVTLSLEEHSKAELVMKAVTWLMVLTGELCCATHCVTFGSQV